jgi:hypothetical protein
MRCCQYVVNVVLVAHIMVVVEGSFDAASI